jgi:hypothetical protein
MTPLLSALAAAALACPASATGLVLTHPETEYDASASAGPRAQELLASREFREKVVLTARPDRAHYSFDPDAPGVSFTRRVSADGRLEEDLREREFVLGGALSDGLEETAADLLAHSRATRLRFDLAAVSARTEAPAEGRPARSLKALEAESPAAARALALRSAERVYGLLRRHGLGDMGLELRWHGRTLGVVDHSTYSDATPAGGEAAPRLRGAGGRPPAAVLDFD